MSRGFGLTFLFINLYTRFFEHFWDHMHKAIFFALLAVSFWCLGTQGGEDLESGTAGQPEALNPRRGGHGLRGLLPKYTF